jgi:hypothetical protein
MTRRVDIFLKVAINAWNRAAIAFRATPQLTSAKIAA